MSCNVIIQARMGSTRFPGKMMEKLCGRPLIDHALIRLSKTDKLFDEIIVATSDEKGNDRLVEHLVQNWPQIKVVRGDEHNVLSRFITAIDRYPSEFVVRVTGDCPLVNVEGIRRMLEEAKKTNADIVNYLPGYEYIDKGVEVVKAKALQSCLSEPKLNSLHREHVTSLIYKLYKRFNIRYIENNEKLKRSDIRITVDNIQDLEFLNSVCDHMAKEPVDIDLLELVSFIDRNPLFANINFAVGSKSTMHESMRIGFRCDGGPSLGMGHVVGCLRLAQKLSKRGFGVEFVVKEQRAVVQTIRAAGFAVEVIPSHMKPHDDVRHLIKRSISSAWDIIVINFSKADLEFYASYFSQLKKADTKLVFMDNPIPPSCYDADLVINALPHPDYSGYHPDQHDNICDGLEYLMLEEAHFQSMKRKRLIKESVQRVLISMGGGDADNVSLTVLRALTKVDYHGFVDIVLGDANPHYEVINDYFITSGLRGEIHRSVSNLPERINLADIGFTSLGLTTYEMSALQLPLLIISTNDLNKQVANIYASSTGAANHIGLAGELNIKDVAEAFEVLSNNYEERLSMGARGSKIGSKSCEIVERLASLHVQK